jgi:hypothetical protein
MKVKPDLSESIEGVKPGQYQAMTKKCELKESRAGAKYLKWELEITNHPEVSGRKLWTNTMLSGKGAFRLQELYLAATGETLPKDNAEFDTEQIIGQTIGVQVVDGVDQQGQPSGFPEVKKVSRLSVG